MMRKSYQLWRSSKPKIESYWKIIYFKLKCTNEVSGCPFWEMIGSIGIIKRMLLDNLLTNSEASNPNSHGHPSNQNFWMSQFYRQSWGIVWNATELLNEMKCSKVFLTLKMLVYYSQCPKMDKTDKKLSYRIHSTAV